MAVVIFLGKFCWCFGGGSYIFGWLNRLDLHCLKLIFSLQVDYDRLPLMFDIIPRQVLDFFGLSESTSQKFEILYFEPFDFLSIISNDNKKVTIDSLELL